MKNPVSLATRIGLGFAAVVSLLILITAVGIQRVGFIDSTLEDVGDNAAKVQRYAINFRGSVHNRAIALRDAVLVNNDQDLALHLEEMTRLEKDYIDSAAPMDQLFSRPTVSAEERQLLRGIKEIEQQTLGSTKSVIALRRTGDIAGAQALLLSQTSGDYSEWLKRINALIDHEEASIRVQLDNVQATASQFRGLMLLATAFAVLLSIVLSVFIIRFVKKTLGAEPVEVAQAIRRLAAGDLQQTITTAHPDSVMGVLKIALTRLSETITEVRTAAQEVSQSSTVLSAASSANNTQIMVQTREAEQVATAISQMAATVNEVSVVHRLVQQLFQLCLVMQEEDALSMPVIQQPGQVQIGDVTAIALGFQAFAENLPGNGGIQLIAIFQLGKLAVIAVQRGAQLSGRGFFDDCLHVIKRLVRRSRCQPMFDTPGKPGARRQHLVIKGFQRNRLGRVVQRQ